MNHLIFYTSTNQKNKSDATGAFIPEAENLKRYLRKKESTGGLITMVPIETTNVSHEKRRMQIEDFLYESTIEYDHVYFLCHGYKTGIQFGYNWESGALRLVRNIQHKNTNVKSINFYCCNVTKSKNNFALWVFKELQRKSFEKNVQVFGHFTKGHTTKNPCIKMYLTGYNPFIWSRWFTPFGYNELIHGNKKEAKEMLQDVNNDLRFSVLQLPNVLKSHGFTWNFK